MQKWHYITYTFSVDRLQCCPLCPAPFVANAPHKFAWRTSRPPFHKRWQQLPPPPPPPPPPLSVCPWRQQPLLLLYPRPRQASHALTLYHPHTACIPACMPACIRCPRNHPRQRQPRQHQLSLTQYRPQPAACIPAHIPCSPLMPGGYRRQALLSQLVLLQAEEAARVAGEQVREQAQQVTAAKEKAKLEYLLRNI